MPAVATPLLCECQWQVLQSYHIDGSCPFLSMLLLSYSQEEHISELTCTVEAMKLKIAQLKEALSTAQATAAKLNCGCKDN